LCNGHRIKVLLLADNPEWWHLKYLSYLHNKNIDFLCDYSRLLYDQIILTNASMCWPVQEADFFIDIKERFTEFYLMDFNSAIRRCFNDEKDNFLLIREDDHCRIYQRK
jgi:hypothetical protein